MDDKLLLKAKNDHVLQWIELVTVYTAKRGADPGIGNKAVPRTTCGDVEQIARWWDNELKRVLLLRGPALKNDKSPSSRKEWMDAKRVIDERSKAFEKSTLYPDNQWFWQKATKRLAIYLESLKVVPTDSELMFDAIGETLAEHAQTVKDAAKEAVEAGSSWLKTGVIVAAGIAGAAIILPPVIRALRDDDRR